MQDSAAKHSWPFLNNCPETSMRVVVRRMAVTFEKRNWGSGRATWRERKPHKRRGDCRYSVRRLSNKEAKRREMSGDVCLY